MIPILYEASEKQFISNGIGRLADAVSCVVTEERNGKYELELEYPVSGKHYGEIQEGAIICAVPSDGKEKQPFVVYEISKPLKGVVTIYAEHVSYLLTKSVAMPFMATSAPDAMAGISVAAVTQIPFQFWTSVTTSANFSNTEPTSIRSLLGGMEGSILDVYGGEYEWDKWTVKLHNNRGQDRGVTIRYGKNLTDLTSTTSTAGAYTGIVPYARWADEQGHESVLTLPEKVVWNEHRTDYAFDMAVPMDFSDRFSGDTAPTESELREISTAYINGSKSWQIDTNLKVSFVALWQTEEYKNIAPLQRVNLCDIVTVIHPELGVNAQLKVVKTEYDVLQERYNSLELGYLKSNFGTQVAEDAQAGLGEIREELNVRTTQLEQYVNEATTLITGGLGGTVVINQDANGKPTEICILGDSDDITEATKVWRWNMNGLGYSSTGYNGQYALAMTNNGAIVADFITAGKMSANMLQGGTLSLGGLDNVNGSLRIYDETGAEIGSWTKDGVVIKKGELIGTLIRFLDGESYITNDEIRSQALRIYQTDGTNSWHVGSWVSDFTTQQNHRLWSGAPIKVGSEWKDYPTSLESGCVSTYYGEISDRRRKQNIEDIDSEKARAFIMGLKPVSYSYNDFEVDKVHHGFVAQDVQEVVTDDWSVVRQDENEMLSLNYTEIIADLVKTVQGLANEIEELKKGATK